MIPLIPDWLVYGSMFYLSFTALWCSRRKIYIDPIHFTAFLPQAFMYLIFDIIKVDIPSRAAFVRLSLFVIPMYFSVVLTLLYWSRK